MIQPNTTITDRLRVVRYPKTRLTVTRGPDAGRSIDLVGSAIKIGSAEDNDLVLNDESVSRRHCEIVPAQNGIRIIDNGSTNGVIAGSFLLVNAMLVGASQLELGNTVIRVTPLAETVEREQLDADRFGELLGASAPMRELFAQLIRFSPTELSVLIEGETGTGKELVADSIHRASLRSDKPFIIFDCSSVAGTLVESELFGHERGAFTGAVSTRIGVFEQANGGTIFLDELGELPKDLQPKLLRVLEKREIRRVGGSRTIPIDVRLISATNRNLRAEVQRGTFREDLYFRVAGACARVPPLRERMDDLKMLVDHFSASATPQQVPSEIPERTWEMLRSHRWPGNVRELKNAVLRMLVSPERVLEQALEPPVRALSTTLTQDSSSVVPLRTARREAVDAFELSYLKALMGQANGRVGRAAVLADVSRQLIHSLIAKHGL